MQCWINSSIGLADDEGFESATSPEVPDNRLSLVANPVQGKHNLCTSGCLMFVSVRLRELQ